MNNYIFRWLGVVLILGSIALWFNPIFDSGQYLMTFDFTEIKIPVCLFLIISGVLCIKSSFSSIHAKRHREVICENCNTKYNAKNVLINICPKCNGKLAPFEENKLEK